MGNGKKIPSHALQVNDSDILHMSEDTNIQTILPTCFLECNCFSYILQLILLNKMNESSMIHDNPSYKANHG